MEEPGVLLGLSFLYLVMLYHLLTKLPKDGTTVGWWPLSIAVNQVSRKEVLMILYSVNTERNRNKFELRTPLGKYTEFYSFENCLAWMVEFMNDGQAFEVHYIHPDGVTKIDVTDTFKLMV